ncbi:MAG: glycosyltransferase family 4 protein [Sumerlaeia bacterium]
MKRLTAINFFPAFTPPRSGGELRYWHLLTRLSRGFEVAMFNPTYGEHEREEVRHTPSCVETRLPKTRRYNAWHHFLDRYAGFSECSAFVCAMAGASHAEMRDAVRESAERSDVVLHCFPYLYDLYPQAKGSQVLAYDAHNVECRMARDMFGTGLRGRWATGRVRARERALARESSVIFACSDEDAEVLSELYYLDRSKIVVVPNGVDVRDTAPAKDMNARHAARETAGIAGPRPAILFIGSFHPPNMEAARFIIEKLAPIVDEADFLIAGKACQAFDGQPMPDNVKLLGLVDEETKRALLQGCDAAINPMFSGSGTNLKMLDFLASGLPVITTDTGARGLALEHREHAMIADEARIPHAVEEVLGSRLLRKKLAENARAHTVANFSWDVIAGEMRNVLEIKTRPRILILNDFPVTPVDLGGKVRLQAVGREMAKTGHPVTILTLTKKDKGRRIRHGAHFEELNVPRSLAHNLLDKVLSRACGGVGADDVSALRFCWLTPAFRNALRRESRNAVAVMISHCYLVRAVRHLHGRIPLFHDSYNVESDLKKQLYSSNPIGKLMLRWVMDGEREAIQRSAVTTCVTRDDREEFIRLFSADEDRLLIADNGVDTDRFVPLSVENRPRLRQKVGFSAEPVVLFLASGHPPNAEAARYIIQHVAPPNPECTFLFVGTVCGWFHQVILPENVLLLGLVSEEAKDFLLQTADIALNPVFGGSGTNIKILDYLSAGVPVVTTEKGARGIEPEHRHALAVCEPEGIAEAVRRLAGDLDERRRLAEAGRKLAEERFDWRITLGGLVQTMRETIDENSDYR